MWQCEGRVKGHHITKEARNKIFTLCIGNSLFQLVDSAIIKQHYVIQSCKRQTIATEMKGRDGWGKLDTKHTDFSHCDFHLGLIICDINHFHLHKNLMKKPNYDGAITTQ